MLKGGEGTQRRQVGCLRDLLVWPLSPEVACVCEPRLIIYRIDANQKCCPIHQALQKGYKAPGSCSFQFFLEGVQGFRKRGTLAAGCKSQEAMSAQNLDLRRRGQCSCNLARCCKESLYKHAICTGRLPWVSVNECELS